MINLSVTGSHGVGIIMKNFVLNGAMNWDQNQEGAIYNTNPSLEIYSLDQWRIFGGGNTGAFSVQREAISYKGFQYCLQASITTPQTSIGSLDNYHIEHPIEGSQMVDWKFGTAYAETLAISFSAVANVAGDYSFALMNGTNNRSYTTSFNMPTANAWYDIGLIIPGDTSGTWATTDATFGAKLLWSLGACSLCSTSTTEVWQGSATWNKTGTVQLITQGYNKNIYVTGVQCEIGNSVTPFEFLEPNRELARLQRFYYKTFPKGTAVGNSKGSPGSINYIAQNAGVNGNGVQVQLPVKMCGYPPVFTFCNPTNNDSNWYNQSVNASSGAPSIFSCNESGFFLYNPQVSADTKGSLMNIHCVANARLGGN